MVAYVIIPGIDGSDERHWQSRWEQAWGDAAVRIAPASWNRPELRDWVAAVQAAYDVAVARDGGVDGRVALVAHSLGCWAAAEWLARARPRAVPAFLAAPPDPRGPAFPGAAAPTFLELSARPLPGPALVVASENDPYADATASAALASGWRAPWRSVGAHGHLNSASGLGDWPVGRELLHTLVDP
ncbi:RBBP9/YdeN family alpha/beta hydrolase [Streptomyces hyaluromycini]|uniref:RBBP9/YdeN family alpha/beta hydrolase n=1 Tax=Streptomyces hyaluromycini TaxID=1377993 RepID=UPI000B5C9199|nr:alpha/beta hydrolase [Streptomyces hyaluromycini]